MLCFDSYSVGVNTSLKLPVGVYPLQLVNLHRNRRYFVIKLHTWFCLSYSLKTNIKCYCIYHKFCIIIKQHYLEKNCWNLLIWVTGHCNRAAVSRNRYGVEKTYDTHKILINAITRWNCQRRLFIYKSHVIWWSVRSFRVSFVRSIRVSFVRISFRAFV
jgi:hypothetical protein